MVTTWQDLFPFTSRTIEVGEHRIHYVDEGCSDGAKPVLLMVHGNPTWSFYWRDLIADLRSAYRVIAIDHIGCGLSDKPQTYDYRLAQHVENLSAVVKELGLERISLLVHDWGGAIGMGFAVQHPELIASTVVFNSAAFPAKRIPLRISMCRIPGIGKLAIQGLNGFAVAATYMATAKGMSRAVKQGYLHPYDSFAHRIATYRFVEDIPMKPSHPSWSTLCEVEAGLGRLGDRPMLLLWGEKDWCFDMSFLEIWKQKFPAAEVKTFADAGHYVVEDAATEIIPVVRHFLERTTELEQKGTPDGERQRLAAAH